MKTTRKLSGRKARTSGASGSKRPRRRVGSRSARKQLQIAINGEKPLVIDLISNEAIDIHVQHNATKFLKPGDPATVFRASGHRWTEQDYFILNWGGRILKLGDSVLVRVVEGALKATPLKETEQYIEPEKECSFCHRRASEVKELLEANLFTRICDDCVMACYHKLYGKHAT